ncbi:MAG: serine hydrolase [Thalassobius sp.]|nr:serine hydrolase [Thalassovita sp.]
MKLFSFRIWLFAGLIFLSLNLSAQEVNVKKIDKYLSDAQVAWNVPGMAVAIVKDGEVILSKGYGTKEIGKKEKVDEKTLFAIASNTKAFIASSLAVLVGEGKINWDDKVQKYLPRFAMYDSYVSSHITIRDLLCHRAGLGTFSGDVIWYKSERSAAEVVEKIQYIPQAYDFRSGYGYSNVMFITAGEVIKAVTGKTWSDYVKETFFKPLGMERSITSTNDLDSKGNFAIPHKPTPEEVQAIDWVNWDNMGAAGGIISSVEDMSKWMMLQLNSGILNSDTIIKPEYQNIMWTPHNSQVVSVNAKKNQPGRHFNAYGLAWGLQDYYGNMIVTHSGGYDGMYSRVMMIPDIDLGIVILTNTMEGITTPLCYYILNSFIGKEEKDWSAEALERARKDHDHEEQIAKRRAAKVENTKPTHNLSAYTGTYFDPFYGEIKIYEQENQLRIDFEKAPLLSATLKHWHYDTWEIIWDDEQAWFDFGTVQFELDNNLNVSGLQFDVPNYDIFFEELNMKKKVD